MYKVMVEERLDECSSGAYEYDTFESLAAAKRAEAAGRLAYSYGAVWVEDEHGNIW